MKTKHSILLALAGLMFCALAHAQTPALTTITQAMFGASGDVTVVANQTFTTSDGYVVPKGYEATATVAAGVLSIELPPNVGATPSGTSYTAFFNVSPGGQYKETWVVPASDSPVDFAAVRTSPAPTPSLMWAFSQLNPPANCLSLGGLPEYTADGWTCVSASGTGTVTSVGLTLPAWLTASGSPVTTSGTLAVTAASGQTAHRFLGTGTGASFGPVAITRSDLPAILSADLPVTIAADTSGNAATASALVGTPTLCDAGSYPLGILANGNATGCTVAGTGGGGSGTVTSVALTAPTWLSVGGSPVTTSGTLALSAATGQTENEFLATPNGAAGAVGLRAITAADLPAMITSDTSGNAATATSATTAATASACATTNGCWPNTAAAINALGPFTFSTSGNAGTATALAAAGTECSAGAAARGVDASGNALDCFTPPVTTDASDLTAGTLAAARLPAFTGDVTTSAGSAAMTLASVITAGSCTNCDLTVDAKGRVTAASNGTAGDGGSSAPLCVQTVVQAGDTLTGSGNFATTCTLPTADWSVGKTYDVFAAGIAHNTGGATAAHFGISLGATALTTPVGNFSPAASSVDYPWTFTGHITCTATGASGTLRVSGIVTTWDDGFALSVVSTVTIDLSADNDLEVVLASFSANTDSNVIMQQFIVR